MNAANAKLELLGRYIEAELSRWPQIQGVVVVGSVAGGVCRADSDVDTYVFFHPAVDEAVVPAESLYVFSTGEYHDIFADLQLAAPDSEYIQLDAKRVPLSVLVSDSTLTEGDRAQLAAGIVAWDRTGHLTSRLRAYVDYPDELRRKRLLEHLGWASYLLADRQIQKWLDRHGWLAAQDQITAAVEHLVRALFAYNSRWEPYRSLWLEETSRLVWQPAGLQITLEEALITQALTQEDLGRRLAALDGLWVAILARLVADGLIPGDATDSWLFHQTHSGLGYAHNMSMWQEAHAALRFRRGTHDSSGELLQC